MGRRRKARELALQALYAWEVGGGTIEQAVEDQAERRHPGPDALQYARRVAAEVFAHRDELDARIDACLVGWDPARVAMVERTILRMALAEVLYIPPTPPAVALNEAVDLARTFSTDDAGRFVNGVLDRALKEAAH